MKRKDFIFCQDVMEKHNLLVSLTPIANLKLLSANHETEGSAL